jgi:REP element-mobilizing transposase RayT
MGRDLRTIDNERIYHVMCRGNNRGPIVWDRHDYESLVRELSRAATHHRWDVLAWCVLPNHYHVLMRTPFGGFSDGFQVLNGSHARRMNRRHGRSDHLFKNRPLSVEVSSDAHLVTAILYIARNPVAAGLCASAAAWPWASYRATIGAEPAPKWLVVAEVQGFFGRTPEAARSELARLVQDGHLPVSDTKGNAPPLRT